MGENKNPPHQMQRIRDRDRIQTCNRLIRSQLLYSVELRGHYFVIASAKVALSFIFASLFGIFFLTNQASLG